MKCEKIKKLLPDFLEHKLTEIQTSEITEHLDSCSDCAYLFQQFKISLGLLRPKAELPTQAYYFTRLKQKMENKQQANESLLRSALSRKLFQPLIYLASLILAVYIGILIGSNPTGVNQFSETSTDNTDYIETYAKYQYLNDFESEPIESLILEDDDLK